MSQSSPVRRGFVEVAAIVGSILLAFAIDAAWESQQQRAEAAETLRALETEFMAERSELARHRARWVEVREATERLIYATSVDIAPSPAVMDTLLFLPDADHLGPADGHSVRRHGIRSARPHQE
jgi:hypothetical protein